jgi:hypothetical protein
LPRVLEEAMAGPGVNPVQGFRTGRDLHWEGLRLWVFGPVLSSPAHGRSSLLWPKSESKYFRFYEVAFKKIAGSKVLDEYYNSYLRK